jgi:hypothetical protein
MLVVDMWFDLEKGPQDYLVHEVRKYHWKTWVQRQVSLQYTPKSPFNVSLGRTVFEHHSEQKLK